MKLSPILKLLRRQSQDEDWHGLTTPTPFIMSKWRREVKVTARVRVWWHGWPYHWCPSLRVGMVKAESKLDQWLKLNVFMECSRFIRKRRGRIYCAGIYFLCVFEYICVYGECERTCTHWLYIQRFISCSTQLEYSQCPGYYYRFSDELNCSGLLGKLLQESVTSPTGCLW